MEVRDYSLPLLKYHDMATTDSILLHRASGTVGKQIVYKKYYDKVVISKMPNMKNRVLSEKQVEANHQMRCANNYAKSQYTTEEQKIAARIRLKVPAHKSVYHALVKEYLTNQTLQATNAS
jgi:hypothetical protein